MNKVVVVDYYCYLFEFKMIPTFAFKKKNDTYVLG